ncbi:hypothetical protein JNJ66_03395 [Candidatus Saccharibacteria bacterium]|nr:hypothetical protein [Candidatus Saccharibacteria bacterium]
MNEGNLHKARIVTPRGTFEFEGSQEFVEKQIDKVVDIEKNAPAPSTREHDTPLAEEISKPKAKTKTVTANGSPKKSSSEQPKMLPNLIPKDQIAGLREFYASKSPDSHPETFAVLSYWLKDILSVAEVSIDEMWTLYKVLQIRAPKVMIQVFRDAKSKKAYFDISKSGGKYYLTSFGETFVEYDLPRTPKQKS